MDLLGEGRRLKIVLRAIVRLEWLLDMWCDGDLGQSKRTTHLHGFLGLGNRDIILHVHISRRWISEQ